VKEAFALFERNQALAAALRERNGALVLAACEKATRWQTDGRLTNGHQQTPPMVKFFDPDGVRSGYFDPKDPDAIYIARGLSDEETLLAVGHEVSHHLRRKLSPWSPDNEELARIEEELFLQRYLRSLGWEKAS
jgi:hypothetical protein